MTDKELIVVVKSIHKSLCYCAPEAAEELLFDKLHPYIVGPSKRIAELEERIRQLESNVRTLINLDV